MGRFFMFMIKHKMPKNFCLKGKKYSFADLSLLTVIITKH